MWKKTIAQESLAASIRAMYARVGRERANAIVRALFNLSDYGFFHLSDEQAREHRRVVDSLLGEGA
jgi:hypothetical protein